MSEDDLQNRISAFLRDPATHGVVEAVEVIETHISRIFLAGSRALKMKRAVAFPYLDFTTLEKRHTACQAEVATNRRTAPQIYRGVVAVTATPDGGFQLAGDGPVCEWLVDMNRFDEAGIFERLVRSGEMRRHPMIDLADHIVAFHRDAEARLDAGGARGTASIVDNVRTCLEAANDVLAPAKIDRWSDVVADALRGAADILDARRDAGCVRHCHGDMHLRNICMVDDAPVLFDGIEFNPEFSEIDTLYDLAFLLMDLDFRGYRRLANIVMNRYFDVTGAVAEQSGACQVLPLFLSMRAAVRAHVDAAQAADIADPATRHVVVEEAGRYLDKAIAYLAPPEPRIVAVGGLSGGGKSRMARELAPGLAGGVGARVVRTDAVRKRISGVKQEARLGADGYTADMHEKTYEAFYGEVRTAIRQGIAVVMDAVFPSPAQRKAAAAIAESLGVPFQGLWIEAPEEVRVARVKSRQRNISDVTEAIAREQSGYDLGEITWTRIDSSGAKDATVAKGRQVLGID